MGSSNTRKRGITPSSEACSPKNRVIIAPIDSIPNDHIFRHTIPLNILTTDLFPDGQAFIERRHPLQAHPEPNMEPESRYLPLARQIVMPFNLHRNPEQFHEKRNFNALFSVFHGIKQILFDGWVLVFILEQMPPNPFPKKVAGVPCYLTTEEADGRCPTVPLERRGVSQVRISDHLDLRDKQADVNVVFDSVLNHFHQSQISITEIQYWGRVIAIVLEDDTDEELKLLSELPKSVAKCRCVYLFESEMDRPAKIPAFGLVQTPPENQYDSTTYDTMRPGIMVSSGKEATNGNEFLTSSGVMVRNGSGEQYMTVAAHGFPGELCDGKVYHPRSRGKEIGEMIMEISQTDVGLAKLHPGVEFVNEPFENTLAPEPSFKLRGFKPASQSRIGDDVFMDNPFSGFIEGTRGAHSLLRIPSDDPHKSEQQWMRCHWNYMGQGSSTQLVDSVSGSAVWDSDHRVLGFFRYAPKSGRFVDWAMNLAADHLIDRGYAVV